MTAVATIKPHLSAIKAPDEMRALPAWLVWRYEYHEGEDKPRKVPYYTAGPRRHGKQGTPEDRQQLTTFDAARTAAARRGFDGVGFVPMPEFNICALDFDHCVVGGALHPDLEPIVTSTYAEFSPSGTGVRAFVKGQYGNSKARGEPYGFEVFSSKGFVTFTGNRLDVTDLMGNENTVAEVPAVRELCTRRFTRPEAEVHVSAGEPVGLTPGQIDTLLAALDPDMGHDDWLAVGMGLHHETQGEGFDYWADWSELGSKFPGREVLLQRWSSFGKNHERTVTIRTAMKMAGMTVSGPASPDEFEELVDTPADPAKPPRFLFEPVHTFASVQALPWIIKGVLPKAGLGVVYGASGSGKSFAVLDMSLAVARGTEWRGRRVKQGRVAYIAAEGADGFRKRLAAYALHQGVDLAGVPMTVLNAAPNLLEKQDAADIAKGVRAAGGADLIIVDTFAQTTPGANENAGEDVGKALGHCKRIHEATGAMVVLIHHSGKDATKGARGWSGLRAAADAEIEVVREPTGRYLRLSKSKDGEDGLEWGFDLEVVQLGVDDDLDPITSCVVVETAVPAKGGVASRKLGKNEKVVNEVLQEIALAQTSGIEIRAVLDESVRRMKGRDGVEEDKKGNYKANARRALHNLCQGDDAPYWLDPETNTIEVV